MIRKIEPRNNEFVTTFRKMVESTFPAVLGYRVEYNLGEDQNGIRGLHFEMTSKMFGTLYQKFGIMEPHQTVADIEEEFMNIIINDFIIAGIGLFNFERFKEMQNEKAGRGIVETPFKRQVPMLPIFFN